MERCGKNEFTAILLLCSSDILVQRHQYCTGPEYLHQDCPSSMFPIAFYDSSSPSSLYRTCLNGIFRRYSLLLTIHCLFLVCRFSSSGEKNSCLPNALFCKSRILDCPVQKAVFDSPETLQLWIIPYKTSKWEILTEIKRESQTKDRYSSVIWV